MRPSDNIEKKITNTNIETNPDTDKLVLNDAVNAMSGSKHKATADNNPARWRIIMKTKAAKLAIAAMVLIASLIGINQFGGSIDMANPVFAEIVQPLLSIETGSFKMTINVLNSNLDWINCEEETVQTIEVLFSGPLRTRWNVPTGEVLVANMQDGKVMILVPDKMQAAVTQVCPPGVIPRHNRFNKVFELKRLIQHALGNEEDSVEYLGKRQVSGNTAIGYHITVPYSHGDITVWANAKTKLPVQIEQSIGAEKTIITDITYGIELDESLFSVQPPEEYSTDTTENDKQPAFVVRGTVIDAETGKPIAEVRVSDDRYGLEPYKSAISDPDGRYRYLTWPEEHRIKAEASGYKPQYKSVTGLFHAETEDEEVINFILERK